jgi:DNA-binding MarR family transcriptional regulator
VLSVAATGRAVDVLVRHGLVVRREDPVDRRIKRIGLTDAGRETISRLNAARRDGLRQFVSTLSDEERERFTRALAPILDRPDVHSFLQEFFR